MNLIEQNIKKLQKLCNKHSVNKLYIFGSVNTNQFNEKSDIDFLVTFNFIDLEQYADNYFNFKFSLEKLFKRKIDLLEEKAIKNPYLKKSIDNSKKLLYG
jgi:predicted nucleotidyltransferase